MAVATECKPLTHPLPGGSDAATVRLHPLLAGEMPAPAAYLDRRPGRLGRLRDAAGALASRSRWPALPVPAFLVEHPTAGPLLVDTGFHPSVLDGLRANMGRAGPLLYDVRTTREQLIPAQLEARGIAATDVRTVVMTHLHIDHASGVEAFPAATFVVDRREWAAAGAGGGWRNGYHSRQFDHAFDWRSLDYDDPSIDSFATFGQTFDLFGDGSVRLLSTPGHTAGHQSVLLRLAGREALLIGDAAFTWATLRDDATPFLLHDEHRFRRSLGEIAHYLRQTPGALAIPGHDAAAWSELAPVYG